MGGVPNFQLNVASLLPPSLTQAGHSFRGVIAELEGALVIRTNATTIPIADNSGLTPGQQVAVRVLTAGANPQIQVTPLSVVVNVDTQTAALVQPIGSTIAGEIVSQGGKLTFVHGKISLPLPANQTLIAAGDKVLFQTQATTKGILATLTPSNATPITVSPPAQTALQIPVPAPLVGTPSAAQLQALFTQAESLGAGVAALQASIAAPQVVAAIPADIGAALAAMFAPLLRPDSDDLSAVMKRWSQRLAKSPEAALNKAGANTPESPSAVLQMLRADPALRLVLAERGELRAFDSMVDRVLERLGSGNLQQLRSVDQPYWFSEFPFDPASGIERVFVHFFSDDSGNGTDRDAPSASVVLDLSLTRLGDVWVKLVMLSGQCTCHLSVTSEDVLALVREFEDDLAAGLSATGAKHVSVHADLWDGNRIDRSGAMLGALDGMDLSA